MAIKNKKEFADEFAEQKAKIPKLTYEEFLERRIKIMESAIYQHYTDVDELHGVIWMLRNELEKPAVEINHYHARNVLNAIFSLSLKQSYELMEMSEIEF